MGRIVGKLNLNKTPQLVDSGSLIFAKNIKLLKDGSIGQDDSILPISFDNETIRADIQSRIDESNDKIASWLEDIERLKNLDDSISIADCYKAFFTDRQFTDNDTIYSSWSYGGGTTSSVPTFKLVDNEHLSNYIQHDGNNILVSAAINWFEEIHHTGHTELKFPLFPKKLFEYIKGIAINGPGNYWFDDFDYITFADTLYDLYENGTAEDVAFIEDNFEVFPNVAIDQSITSVYHVDYDGGASNMYFCCAIYAWMISYFLINHSKELNDIVKKAKQNSIANDNAIYSQIALLRSYIIKEQAKIDSYEEYLTNVDDISEYDIVGIIPYNTEFYIFLYKPQSENGGIVIPADSLICKYDEKSGFTICPCNWNYSGGIITGQCFVNLNGDTLLNICEYKDDNSILVPIKTINLNDASKTDDETLYTQVPRINFITLSFIEYYNKVIPNGVYQFFIRYKINKNFYTNWFPASKELFAGTKKVVHTPQGPLQYIDTSIDSCKSFHFTVNKLFYNNALNYSSFQIGFILSHNDTIYARSWKEFDFGVDDIYFDYDTEYIEELDLTDILDNTYGLFNVKNLTTFKNKLYISNYIETDFNPDLTDEIDVDITIKSKTSVELVDYYYNYPITTIVEDGVKYITTIDNKTIAEIIRYNLNSLKSYFEHDTTIQGRSVSYKGVTLSVTRTEGLTYPHHNKFYLHIGPSGAITEYPSDNISELFEYIVAEYDNVATNGNFYSSTGVISFPVSLVVIYGTREVVYDLSFSINPSNISEQHKELSEDMCTLMPGQEYEFYIHFVKDTGEYTNGYYIDTKCVEITSVNYSTLINDHPVFYPSFTFNKTLPKGYVACFISMRHTKNYISEIFNIKTDVDDGLVSHSIIGDNLDLDTRQYNDISGLRVINPFGTDVPAIYKASYDNTMIRYFGASGKVLLDSNITQQGTACENAFIKFPYNSNSKYASLTKITPYILYDTVDYEYDNYKDLNLLSYVCTVYKPYDNLDIYVSGNTDVYKKGSTFASGDNVLEEITDKTEWDDFSTIDINDIHAYTIYSNFNLHYLNLVEDDSVVNLIPQIVTKNFPDPNNPNKEIPDRRLLTLLQSITLSEVYELKSMYKDYTRKLYQVYNENNTITFDNTIRSSSLNGDESKINIFKFKATDYYNVPTDKGIIINLVAIGDAIIVHTQDSMYKFSGANSLSAAGGEEVAVKEGEPFDTGIQEIFGSEFGFAGLQYKHQHAITENGYIFFDWDAKMLYLYSGQGQIVPISDAIEKLLNRGTLLDVIFANDFYNDRIFVQLLYEDAFATLSFNVKAKSFVSLHDFTFTNSFHTKTKCYFLKQNKIYVVTDTDDRFYSDLNDSDNLYPYLDSYHYNAQGIVWDSQSKCSIVDVIFNQDYENVKTLNSIDWICNLINSFSNVDNNIKFKLVAEEHLTPYAGGFLRIYTDSTCTDLTNIQDVSNKYALANYNDSMQLLEEQRNIYPTIDRNRVSTNSYKLPRYNLGKWNFNYFRNILNIHDPNTVPGDPTHSFDTPSVSDNRSLIYGKYIIVRFVFNDKDNFKLEDVDFNIARY